MPQQDRTAWLHQAMLGLPKVTADPDPQGGVEYHIGEIGLGRVHQPGTVDLDAEPQLADMVVRSGWAAPNGGATPGRLTIDLAQPQGGIVALWLLCRNYRWARTA
jgi:Luciferase